MKVLLRKKLALVGLLAALAVFCAGAVCFTASASGADAAEPVAFRMLEGASVRLDAEENGLRFTAEIGEEEPAAEEEYHIMIFPAAYFERFSLTAESDFVSVLTEKKATYLDMAADPFECKTAENGMQEGYWYVRGSVTSIKYENINGVFFGIAYAENAEGERTYAAYSDGANERDVVYVASAALAKGGYAQDGAEYEILQTLLTRGVNKANGAEEANQYAAIEPFTLAESLALAAGEEQTLQIGNLPEGRKRLQGMVRERQRERGRERQSDGERTRQRHGNAQDRGADAHLRRERGKEGRGRGDRHRAQHDKRSRKGFHLYRGRRGAEAFRSAIRRLPQTNTARKTAR